MKTSWLKNFNVMNLWQHMSEDYHKYNVVSIISEIITMSVKNLCKRSIMHFPIFILRSPWISCEHVNRYLVAIFQTFISGNRVHIKIMMHFYAPQFIGYFLFVVVLRYNSPLFNNCHGKWAPFHAIEAFLTMLSWVAAIICFTNNAFLKFNIQDERNKQSSAVRILPK